MYACLLCLLPVSDLYSSVVPFQTLLDNDGDGAHEKKPRGNTEKDYTDQSIGVYGLFNLSCDYRRSEAISRRTAEFHSFGLNVF